MFVVLFPCWINAVKSKVVSQLNTLAGGAVPLVTNNKNSPKQNAKREKKNDSTALFLSLAASGRLLGSVRPPQTVETNCQRRAISRTNKRTNKITKYNETRLNSCRCNRSKQRTPRQFDNGMISSHQLWISHKKKKKRKDRLEENKKTINEIY